MTKKSFCIPVQCTELLHQKEFAARIHFILTDIKENKKGKVSSRRTITHKHTHTPGKDDVEQGKIARRMKRRGGKEVMQIVLDAGPATEGMTVPTP